MITQKDIQKLEQVFVTKGEFNDGLEKLRDELKEEIQQIDKSINRIYVSVDAVLKDKITRDQEAVSTSYRIKKTEDWISQASPKVGIEFNQ